MSKSNNWLSFVIIHVMVLTIMGLFIGNTVVAQSTITEDIKTIKTYPFSDPNPVPSMAINSMISPFYPYFVFDGFTEEGVGQDWKVITLENEFINVTVLPEVGGKVWGAVEKSTGKEFIYLNHVLKFRSIGIRGPWTSGGIEHNFGLDLGHAPWTASPVDYMLKENPDGSVSCIVGGLDLASRTQWRVNIKLPKDKAYFETQSMLYNPTPLHDAYLSWENAGIKATDDLQFYFPGNYYIGHGGKTSPWPIDDKGRNLSLYKENNFGTSKSYHVSGTYTNWFGGYWNNENFGFGHWAPYSDAPGKKIWIWSLARDGAIWEDLLTDTDGQYIEVQSGVKFNQASRSSGFKSPFNQLSIRPYYTDTKTEFWFPVVGTRGIVDASPYGTLNVSNSNGSIKISLSPITDINDSLYVTINGNSIYKELLRLKPLQLYEKTIPLSGNEETGVAVVVGKNMLSYYADGEVKKINKPNSSIENPEYNTAEHMFRLGEEVNAMREYKLALEYYLLALQKEPTHSRALSKAAELYYRKADFSEGLNLARKVLRNNAYDAAANYIYGLIKRSMGSLMEAEEAFSVAARTLEYRSGAYLQIAGIKLQMHHYRSAIEYTKKALDYNRLNIQAYEFMAISYRKFDNLHEAAKILDEILEIDPLNHFARFELYLQNPTTENLNNFNSFIRNELPHETYIELALEYYNQGQIDEAIKVLEQSPDYPTVSYWLSYLYRDSSQGKSSQYLKKAVEMSAYLVFPYRLETIPVLDWAMHQNESWKTKYYLGLIYWHILSTENAMELFEKCGDMPDYAPFYLARGILFKDKVMDNCFPCRDFKHAVKMNPEEWRTWHFLNTFLQSKGDFEAQLENSKQAYSRFPANPVIGIDYVKAMINSGYFRESIKLLSKVNILPQEGAREGHDIYELANLSIAVGLLKKEKYKETLKYLNNSKKWPENLGAGKPYDPDTRLQDYISAYCYSLLGKTKLSDTYYNKIANNYNVHVSVNDSPQNIYILAKTLQAQGKYKEAEKLIINLKTKQTSVNGEKIMEEDYSPELQWIIASFYNKHGELAKLETKLQINKAINWNSVFISAIKVIDDNFK